MCVNIEYMWFPTFTLTCIFFSLRKNTWSDESIKDPFKKMYFLEKLKPIPKKQKRLEPSSSEVTVSLLS